jgi:hypothetical protein
MATVKVIQDFGRQYPLTAVQKVTFEDLNDGTLAACTIELPENAIILSGFLDVTVAFNSTTSDSFTLGYDGDADFYLTATDGQAVARTSILAAGLAPVTVAAKVPMTIALTPGTADTATTGVAYVVVEYVVVGRANENQD